MQLKELDALQAEQAKALLGLGLEMLWLPVPFPTPGAGSREARLGRNDQVVGVGVERLVDEPFAHLGAVRIGRVDERHP